jgi:Na+-translocating ferredoxin:NAD+ oxidoreductase RnfD subunit
VRRLLRTPKGLLILILLGLVCLAAFATDIRLIVTNVATAAAVAIVVDAPIMWIRNERWSFPDGALLTGLIVAMILSPNEPSSIVALTTVVSVWSKYLLRSGAANVFNPAALGLVVTFYGFSTGHSWWGALGELPPVASCALLATGAFIGKHVRKLPAIVAFLLTFYLVATVAAVVGDPTAVAELFRRPDVNAALFLAFFMLTDPPTSPPKTKDQPLYGAIAAVIGFAVFELVGAAHFLLVGLLGANVWEAWRRKRRANQRALRRWRSESTL